ncbi:ATP-binding protein [Streptomyces sp. NBC_00140]|uniref:ATP-binding protein n=1 Tax=Streptomyces sp. NBC_00140 TaxID=2975664 RepID=UPI002255AABD|nr:ATP-binding protein [Streptomyces sp. NBC_00140]MCX5336920.1 ATP-binding protein [Streptomyces sp. NBC_00140]MCX5338403.1 ATP-binding protein [Streptomyces sp. NBC_00140]
MTTLHIPRGLPGSGKTTLARTLAAATGATHVQLDAHRQRLWPDCPPSWDPYHGQGLAVQHAFEAEITAHLAAGRDVIADRTNLHPEGLRRLEHLSGRLVIHDLRHTPLADCLARDHARPAGQRVGPDGIRALHHRWL